MQELEEILEHSPEWWGKKDKEIYNSKQDIYDTNYLYFYCNNKMGDCLWQL